MRYTKHLEEMHKVWKEAYAKGFEDGVHAADQVYADMLEEESRNEKAVEQAQRNSAV